MQAKVTSIGSYMDLNEYYKMCYVKRAACMRQEEVQDDAISEFVVLANCIVCNLTLSGGG